MICGGKILAHSSFREDHVIEVSSVAGIWTGWPQQIEGDDDTERLFRTAAILYHLLNSLFSSQTFLQLCNTPNDCCMSEPMYRFEPGQRVTLTDSGLFGSCHGFAFNALKWPTSWRVVCRGVEECSDSRIYLNTPNTFATGYIRHVPANQEGKIVSWSMTLHFPLLF